ncbi:MAG: peroxidase family protein [Paraglaciecola sp.]|uniref:peroxidase family protein n=2 Tax=Paraglaciecola sp. TaxID=1920173 RepID=UPI0032645552
MNQPRLFPIYAKEPLLTECQIKKVAEYLTGVKPKEAQKNNTKSVAKNDELSISSHSKLGKLDAGYTYFGQFIAHEIVPCSNPEPSEHNYTTSPELDLKSLYGEPSQYSMLFDDEGKFRVSDNRPYDVIRDENGRALIPDQRNDENAIILQFHVLWQKIHNKIIDLITPSIDEKCKLNSVATHNEARKITTALFQYLTIYDYAERILHPKVFKCYFGTISKAPTIQTKEYILKDNTKLNAIPVEFSHAVFRFGHSMVRGNYKLNIDSDEIKIRKLFRGNKSNNIEPEYEIKNWSVFFDEKNAQPAEDIDLFITQDMAEIPVVKHIVQLNLKAGEKLAIPSGYWIKDWILQNYQELAGECNLTKCDTLTTGNYKSLIPYYKLLNKHYKCHYLPLWLYTIEEARLEKPISRKLGVTTSIVIAEVLRKSILSEQLNTNPDASFPQLKNQIIKNVKPIFSDSSLLEASTMAKLIQFLK